MLSGFSEDIYSEVKVRYLYFDLFCSECSLSNIGIFVGHGSFLILFSYTECHIRIKVARNTSNSAYTSSNPNSQSLSRMTSGSILMNLASISSDILSEVSE